MLIVDRLVPGFSVFTHDTGTAGRLPTLLSRSVYSRCSFFVLYIVLNLPGEVSQTAGLWCDRWTNGHTPVNSGWCANPMPATVSASLGLTRSVVQGLGHGARGTTVGLA